MAFRVFSSLVVAAAIAAVQPPPLLAQSPSLAGLWDLTWETPRGEQTLRLTLVATDAGFAGTAETRMGEAPVKNGVVEGDAVSFVIEMTVGRPGGDRSRTLEQTFEGTLADGVVTGEMSMPAMRAGGPGGPRPFTMKRVEG